MDSLRGKAHKIFKIRGLKKLTWIKKTKLNKGSLKDPFFCLGGVSIILFGLVVFLVPHFLSNIDCLVYGQNAQSEKCLFAVPETRIQESPNLSLVQKNSLSAISPPITVTPQVLGALAGGSGFDNVQKAITEYAVEPGDNLWSIADKFNISLDTLLWANNLNKSSLIQIGQKLVILPVSGLVHHVKSGETIGEITETYEADQDEIISFNDLPGNGNIYIGDILIVPGGEMPSKTVAYASKTVPLASSYFICPISEPCRITQGLHWYNAIDFSHGKCGEPIYAAAAGTVLKVQLTNSTSRWAFNGAGNHITILHPNGVVTMYGHIQASLVSPGDQVHQGQVIALMGGQPGTAGAGMSTGCHLHFGVSGAVNPFAY
ncbi:MAG: peptidoglycan DD-metalloendopeptidase family protein [Candidatus Nealsonbacteria bacterium]